jgi:hypothetical protein
LAGGTVAGSIFTVCFFTGGEMAACSFTGVDDFVAGAVTNSTFATWLFSGADFAVCSFTGLVFDADGVAASVFAIWLLAGALADCSFGGPVFAVTDVDGALLAAAVFAFEAFGECSFTEGVFSSDSVNGSVFNPRVWAVLVRAGCSLTTAVFPAGPSFFAAASDDNGFFGLTSGVWSLAIAGFTATAFNSLGTKTSWAYDCATNGSQQKSAIEIVRHIGAPVLNFCALRGKRSVLIFTEIYWGR